MGTKLNPSKYDCYENALPDEPMFILLARDPWAPLLVHRWANKREAEIERGERPESDREMVAEARECAENMRGWRAANVMALTLIAVMLLACPALAQQTTTTSDAASKAAAYASTGSTIFEASRGRNNTPDVFANATQGTTDCQLPGFGFGIGQPGLGASASIPLGTDADCKHERLAAFRMRTAELMMKSGEPVEARRNINAANESLCRVSYNIGTAMCAPTPAPLPVTVYYYCRNPDGYYPAVQRCPSWEMVPR